MKKFSNYDKAKKEANQTGSAKLPVGAYICKIQQVKYTEGTDGNSDRIDLAFDVAEGEYKDFWRKAYDSDTRDDKKWRGRTTIYLPRDDGSEKDAWSKKSFARWTTAFEDSNSGYAWDWDENKWKGKMIGLIYHEVGNVIEGKEVKYTEVSAPCSVDQVKNNTFWDGFLKFKAKNGYTGNATTNNNATSDNSFVSVPDGGDEEIPFL